MVEFVENSMDSLPSRSTSVTILFDDDHRPVSFHRAERPEPSLTFAADETDPRSGRPVRGVKLFISIRRARGRSRLN